MGSALRLVLTASASSTGSGFLPSTGSANLSLTPAGRFLVVTPTFPQGTSVHSGASDLVVARVTNVQGVPVAGALVTMGTTRGTVSPIGAVSGTSGNVTLTLRAPSVTVATQVRLLFVANATGFANGSSIASVTINAGVAPSLYVTIGPSSGNLSAGESVRLTVTVRSTNATGTLVPGASVTLILSDGQYSPTLALTGSTGTANFTYVAPTSLAKVANVTVTASAVATNFASGASTATFAVAAAIPSGSGLLTGAWPWILIAVVLVAVLVLGIYVARRRRHAPPPAARSEPSLAPPAPPAPPAG